MRKGFRYCQHCTDKALTPPSWRKPKMRAGWIYRKHHDLCARCFREALARAHRETDLPLAA